MSQHPTRGLGYRRHTRAGGQVIEGPDVLLTTAEVGITLAGFTGIVAILGRRGRGEWTAADWLRLSMLLALSLGAVFFSFLPFLIRNLGAREGVPWALSSGLLAVCFAVLWASVVRRVLRLGEAAADEFPRVTGIVVLVFSVPIVMVLLLNAVGWPYPPQLGPLLLGVLWLLALAAFQFYRLLRPRG